MKIPSRGITNLYDQRGVKTRLVFFPANEELSIATKGTCFDLCIDGFLDLVLKQTL